MRLRKIMLMAGLLALCGCADMQKGWRHIASSVGGLHRRVTLYAYDGRPIRTWTGTFMVEVDSGVVSFIGDDNMEYKATGTVLVEQIP